MTTDGWVLVLQIDGAALQETSGVLVGNGAIENITHHLLNWHSFDKCSALGQSGLMR